MGERAVTLGASAVTRAWRPSAMRPLLGESSVAGPIFDHGGNAVGAICVVDATEVIFPRGVARGVNAALLEAARGISRELGAARWPPPPAS